ncbi:MAG: hypothetical protein AB7J13_05835, partial [Pyrinomonadaceae bacterium]
MKQIILLLTLVTLAAAAVAQPTTIRRDADLTRLTNRFENVETIKRLPVDKNSAIRLERAIRSAENELGRFKEKYPDFDVSRFEAALAEFKDPQAASPAAGGKSGGSSGTSDFAKSENFVAVVEEILDLKPIRLLKDDDGAIAEAKQKLVDFRTRIDAAITPEFLTLAKDTSDRKISRIMEKAGRDAWSVNSRLKTVNADEMLSETDPRAMLTRYFLIASMLEQVKYLNRIFPSDDKISAANVTADGLIAKLGTLDEVEAKARENYAAKVAANRMLPEVQNNAALRTGAINAFNSSIYRKPGDRAIKAHLLSSGWGVERNELTGVILNRSQRVHIAYKAADGKCYTYLMIFEQKHLGGNQYRPGRDRSGT